MECEVLGCKNDAAAIYLYTTNKYQFCKKCGENREEFKVKDLPTSSGSDVAVGYEAIEVTEEMLTRAMKEAVKQGVFPKYADEATYLAKWAAMKTVLASALKAL